MAYCCGRTRVLTARALAPRAQGERRGPCAQASPPSGVAVARLAGGGHRGARRVVAIMVMTAVHLGGNGADQLIGLVIAGQRGQYACSPVRGWRPRFGRLSVVGLAVGW
ncbi:MFS transporter OS=Streptomyces microflavus OX=1919 GN=G3I39_14730 PE=4 SV=1 [Streptomyces microflavus]